MSKEGRRRAAWVALLVPTALGIAALFAADITLAGKLAATSGATLLYLLVGALVTLWIKDFR